MPIPKYSKICLIPLVVLFTASSFMTACSKKHSTTDSEQLQAVSGKRNLTVGYIAPTRGLFGFEEGPTTLVVYLHGLGANWQQPFVLPWKHTYADSASHIRPGVTFMSMQYGAGGKWVDENAFDDITSGINKILEKYPSDRIVLTGCSMGASTVLSYAVNAPENIRKKIVGVVAMYPAGDFVELYATTQTPIIKSALEQCFGGTPDDPEIKKRYVAMSVIPQIDKFPKEVKVYLMSATADASLPPALQKKLLKALRDNNISTEFEEVNGPHDNAPSHKSYEKALQFCLSGN